MADGGVRVAGLKEAFAKVERLPEAMIGALKEVARDTAGRIVEGYRERLLAQTKARRTAASARVLDESDEKQFVANVPGHPDDPANLPKWLEEGTRHMSAKPSLRPAGYAENDRYQRDMATAAEGVLKDLVD